MKIEQTDHTTTVTLSRTNLLTLLAKLASDSVSNHIYTFDRDHQFLVEAEPDAQHYANSPGGELSEWIARQVMTDSEIADRVRSEYEKIQSVLSSGCGGPGLRTDLYAMLVVLRGILNPTQRV